MKILHFITSLKIGGAEIALCNLLEYWRSSEQVFKHYVAYFHEGPCSARIKALGIPTYHIKGLFFPYDLIALRRFERLIKKIKPDIVHSALWSANIMACFTCKKYNIPLICDLHGDCRYHGRIRNFFERITLGRPKKFVAVANSVQKSFLNFFKSHEDLCRKTIVIQNGIDVKKTYYRAQENRLFRKDFGIKEDDFVIGTVGRLHKIKRYDLLIESFSKFLRRARAKLCFVGDGSERSYLEKLARDLNLKDNILFFGEQKNALSFYNIFDCFVLSSQSEGLSIALLEALCFGLPIVTTCNVGKHDVITDGVNGIIVSHNDSNSLSKAFLKLYSDRNFRVSVSKSNKDLVKKEFDIRCVADSYVDLYEQVLRGG